MDNIKQTVNSKGFSLVGFELKMKQFNLMSFVLVATVLDKVRQLYLYITKAIRQALKVKDLKLTSVCPHKTHIQSCLIMAQWSESIASKFLLFLEAETADQAVSISS